MKRSFRPAALAAAALVALAVAGSAMAAYQPRIVVKNPSERAGAGGPLTIHVEQPRTDDATFRVVIYVPQGYTTALVPAEGATIGTVTAQAQANAISPDAVLELTGTIRADPTFTAAEYPTGTACLGTAGLTTADAVYRLELSAAGQTLIVPMYAAAITQPPLATLFSAQLIACLPSPYIPQAQGGAAFGAKLINADFTLNNIFTNPTTNGDYRWSGLWTPYTVGAATPNTAGTVETQSVDRLGAQLTVNARPRTVAAKRRPRRAARRTVTVSGTLTENGTAIVGASVRLLLGRTATAVRSVGTAPTRAGGAYSRTFRTTRGVGFARAQVTVADREATCEARFTPVPCIAANVPGFTIFSNRVVRFNVR